MFIPIFCVILVESKFEGNVGAVARSIKNFGIEELILINPPELTDISEKRAMHGLEVLKSAKIYNCLSEAITKEGIDVLVGTSGVVNTDDRCHRRNPLLVSEFFDKIQDVDKKIGLMFGREDFGLLNKELEKCDFLMTIPASEEYPILNLSHAVAIVLYEMNKLDPKKIVKPQNSTVVEKEKFIEYFEDLMRVSDYPERKRENAAILFRRLMARSNPTKWEFYILMGVFASAIKRIKHLDPKKDCPEEEEGETHGIGPEENP